MDDLDGKWEEIRPKFVLELEAQVDDLEYKNEALIVELCECSAKLVKANSKIEELLKDVLEWSTSYENKRSECYRAITIYAKYRDEEPGYWWALNEIKRIEKCCCPTDKGSLFKKCTWCLASAVLLGEGNSLWNR